MQYLDGLLTENATEAEVKAALDSLCGYLPQSMKIEVSILYDVVLYLFTSLDMLNSQLNICLFVCLFAGLIAQRKLFTCVSYILVHITS